MGDRIRKSVTVTFLCARAAQGQCEVAELIAHDGVAGDYFGASVAIHGDVAIVGAPEDDDRGASAGSAYVYRSLGAAWTEEAELLASDGAPGDFLGFAVAAADGVAIVGAWGRDERGVSTGAAYVFRSNGAVWTQEAKLTASDGADGDQFGWSAAIGDGIAVVGAPRADAHGADSGCAWVFERVDGQWAPVAKLVPAAGAPGDEFGQAVAASADRVVVGAILSDAAARDAGAAWVFRRGETWVEEAILTASDPRTSAQFGWSVALAGDVAVIGANRDGENGPRAGAAYVFRRAGDKWSEEAKLTAADGAPDDHLGHSVATDGAVAVLGARWDDENGHHAGSGYVFRAEGPAWTERAKLLASDGAPEDRFGFALAQGGDVVIVGAWGNDERGEDSGSAYVFDLTDDCDCAADVDGSGAVDFADLLILLAQWGPCPPVCLADFDGDGVIDFADLLVLLAAWGPCR